MVEIDPALADTAAMTEAYDLPLRRRRQLRASSAGRRDGEERVAACVVRADTRADVNNLVKRTLDVRKASFLAMDRAVEESGMEYGGITPLGLPAAWRLLVDTRVLDIDVAVIGSGVRRSKLLLPGRLLAELPGAEVVEGLGRPMAVSGPPAPGRRVLAAAALGTVLGGAALAGCGADPAAPRDGAASPTGVPTLAPLSRRPGRPRPGGCSPTCASPRATPRWAGWRCGSPTTRSATSPRPRSATATRASGGRCPASGSARTRRAPSVASRSPCRGVPACGVPAAAATVGRRPTVTVSYGVAGAAPSGDAARSPTTTTSSRGTSPPAASSCDVARVAPLAFADAVPGVAGTAAPAR